MIIQLHHLPILFRAKYEAITSDSATVASAEGVSRGERIFFVKLLVIADTTEVALSGFE